MYPSVCISEHNPVLTRDLREDLGLSLPTGVLLVLVLNSGLKDIAVSFAGPTKHRTVRCSVCGCLPQAIDSPFEQGDVGQRNVQGESRVAVYGTPCDIPFFFWTCDVYARDNWSVKRAIGNEREAEARRVG